MTLTLKIPRSIIEVNELPKGWQIMPGRAVFEERNVKGLEDEELLSVSLNYGVLRQSDVKDRKDTSSSDKSNYKLVLPGDLVYNKMRMWQGAVGISKYRGIVSPAYVVLKPRLKLVQEYYIYLFKTQFFINEFNRFSYGLCDDMNSLRYSDFKIIYIIYPPVDQQKYIVDFLDRETSKLDSVISMLSLLTPSTNMNYVKSLIDVMASLFNAISFENSLLEIANKQIGDFMVDGKKPDVESVSEDAVGKVLRLRDLFVEYRNALVHHAVLGNMVAK